MFLLFDTYLDMCADNVYLSTITELSKKLRSLFWYIAAGTRVLLHIKREINVDYLSQIGTLRSGMGWSPMHEIANP